MPKGKKFFTAALAAVKMKKKAEKLTKKKSKKEVSSSESEYSDSSSEYSSSEYSSSDDGSEGGSSYTSDSDEEENNSKPPPRKSEAPVTNKPSTAAYDDDDSSDSSFSNGCGVYRRREDLTPDSSLASSSSDESSQSSYESESEDSTSQHSQSQGASSGEGSDSDYSSESEAPQNAKQSSNEKDTIGENGITNKASGQDSDKKPKKKSFFSRRLSSSGDDKNEAAAASKIRRPSSDSRGSQGSGSEASKSSKGSKVSETSSKKKKLSFGSVAKAVGTSAKSKNSKGKLSDKRGSVDALDEYAGSSSDEESSSSEFSHPSRSSKGSSKVSASSSKYSRKSKSSDVSRSSKASKSGKTSDSNPPQNGVSNPSLFDDDQMAMMRPRAGSGKGAVGVGKPPPVGSKLGRQAKTKTEEEEEDSEDTFGSLLQKAQSMRDMKTANEAKNQNIGPAAMQKYKDSADLSHSFKTQSLKNANANLSTSFTESEEKQKAASISNGKKSSSRFAAMMKDLKSSSDNKTNSNPSTTTVQADADDESDGDYAHVFQAPKIVSDDDVKVAEENSGPEVEKEPEDKRSRFRTRSESMKKLLQSKSTNEESSESSESEEGSDVEVDEEETDDEDSPGKPNRSAYAGEQQHAGSGTFEDDSSEEFSTEDEEEYYEEDQAMTILTPITEADNETYASTIKPKSTDDDSLEKFNSIISPKISVDVDDRKTCDRDESVGSSHGSTSGSDNANENDSPNRETWQSNGHHEPAIISGVDKKYRHNGISNQMSSEQVRMPDVERLGVSEAIARLKSKDPNFTAINLDEAGLNDFNATRLMFSLKDNENITHISLAQNNLGDGSAASLANLLRGNEKIIYLCLRGNQIRDKGASAMGEALEENNTLAHLDLHDNCINPALLNSVERRVYVQDLSSSISHESNGADLDKSSCNAAGKEQQFNSAKISLESNNSGEASHSGQSSLDSIDKNLLDIDKEVSVAAAKDKGAMFDSAISSAMESDERSIVEDSLLLSLSLSLCNLDSEWTINAAGVSKTLGKRRRLAPWNTAETYCKDRESVTDSTDSDVAESEGIGRTLRNGSNFKSWMRSFRKIDPRWQIRKVFNDVSLFNSVLNDMSDGSSDARSIFTVWRPTSAVAITKMMRGEGVGKGLDIKGKSAKEGVLAGFIPFLQIHEEEHKSNIRTIAKGDRTKIFFKKESWRDEVGEFLGNVAKEMVLTFTKANFAMARSKYGCDPNAKLQEEDYAWKAMKAELDDPKVTKVDDYAPVAFGIEVPCKVLWKGLVQRKDISRPPGSNLYTGRESEPAFQDMNFKTLRSKEADGRLPVLYQCAEEDPFDARMMVLAYEEEGKVTPVVSDFDCFLIGTSQFHYSDPIPSEQLDLLDWCVSQIEWILESHAQPECWTTRWLEVLKFAAENDFYPSMPKFGYGDPTSCSIVETSVARLAKSTGAVRHGPECFNYFFPQEVDDHFLVVFPGNQAWSYVSAKELRNILSEKIREGYTFPLNPKWLLCDPGWISLFTELLQSKEPSVVHSMDQWFPRDSGLRERILDISKRFPNGFESEHSTSQGNTRTIAEQDYDRYLVLQRAKRKMRNFIYWTNLLRDVRERANSDADVNCHDALQSLEFLGEKRQELAKEKSSKLEGKALKEIQNMSFFV